MQLQWEMRSQINSTHQCEEDGWERIETWGLDHLHGQSGNFGWKIKWYIPFHFERFRIHGPSA